MGECSALQFSLLADLLTVAGAFGSSQALVKVHHSTSVLSCIHLSLIVVIISEGHECFHVTLMTFNHFTEHLEH